MNSLNTFRIVLVTMALISGSCALGSALAELTSQERPTFPSDPTKITSSISGEAPRWLQFASPFRSDLESNHALIVALQAIQSGRTEAAKESIRNERAQARVKETLSTAPYNSELWLALALLQAQREPRAHSSAEALKMSYFIAPNEIKLMPVRLDIATMFDDLSDSDLSVLVRGDVRLMLTRQTDLKAAVVSAYRRASSLGKAFLEETVQATDPSFVSRLRG